MLTIASIIEKEAKTDADRPKIARVIYNRLAKGMNLEIDATVIYAMGGNVDRLTFDDINNTNSPYNTYKNPGLPPGPIAMPGQASIKAAMNPADGPWLFYVVVDKDGNHAFANDADASTRRTSRSPSRTASADRGGTDRLDPSRRGHRTTRSRTRCPRSSSTRRSSPQGSTGCTSRSTSPRAMLAERSTACGRWGSAGCR